MSEEYVELSMGEQIRTLVDSAIQAASAVNQLKPTLLPYKTLMT